MTAADFKHFLAHLRESKSVIEIAQEFGVSRQAVQQWIDGDTSPSTPTLKLAAVLENNTLSK